MNRFSVDSDVSVCKSGLGDVEATAAALEDDVDVDGGYAAGSSTCLSSDPGASVPTTLAEVVDGIKVDEGGGVVSDLEGIPFCCGSGLDTSARPFPLTKAEFDGPPFRAAISSI